MGQNSKIGWTDHTWNPWRGCTPVGPGCDFCYAMARDLLYESGKDATEPAHFGVGKPRIKAVPHTFNLPYKIARQIAAGKIPARKNRVFTLSLGDFADNEIEDAWRTEFWQVLRQTTALRYLLVTKRIGNVLKMVPPDWEQNFRHCGVIMTAVTQEELNRDAPKLREVKKVTSWVGLSLEPQLELIDIGGCADFVDWAITGGESLQRTKADEAPQPRPYDVSWARYLIRQGRQRGVAIFLKQLGSNVFSDGRQLHGVSSDPWADPDRWAPDLRVQDFPAALQ